LLFKENPKATKCSDHYTIRLSTHTAKVVAMILRKRIEKKLRTYLEKFSLDLAEKKELEWNWGDEKNIRRNYGHR